MNRTIDALISILYPRRCPICDRPVRPPGALICAECERKAEFVREPYCLKCGKPLKDSRTEYCHDCMVRPHVFDSGAAVFTYRSIDRSIYRFKYAKRQEYAAWYGEMIYERLWDRVRKWNPDMLVPVPIHPKRLKKRGYNQSDLLALETGKRMGIPVCRCVEPRVNTAPQKGLGMTERQKNLEKAFKILPSELKSKCVVVIDDIYTTGATVDAVAASLRSAGAGKVYFIALAIGQIN